MTGGPRGRNSPYGRKRPHRSSRPAERASAEPHLSCPRPRPRSSHRHRPVRRLSALPPPPRRARLARQAAPRPHPDDPDPRPRRFHHRRARPSAPPASPDRRARHPHRLPPLLSGLRPSPPRPLHQGDHRLHPAVEFPLPLHRLDHRGLHPRHGAPRADRGLSAHLRPPLRGLARCLAAGHARRSRRRARAPSHHLLHRGADHGGRRGRGGAPPLARLCRAPPRLPG